MLRLLGLTLTLSTVSLSVVACVPYPAALRNDTGRDITLSIVHPDGVQATTVLDDGNRVILREDLSTLSHVIYRYDSMECRLDSTELRQRAIPDNGTDLVPLEPCGP